MFTFQVSFNGALIVTSPVEVSELKPIQLEGEKEMLTCKGVSVMDCEIDEPFRLAVIVQVVFSVTMEYDVNACVTVV